MTMNKPIFCIYCGEKTSTSSTKCSSCKRELEEVIGLAALLEDSTLIYREAVEKKGQIKIKETWASIDSQSVTEHYTHKDFSTIKFMFLTLGLLAAIWIGTDYLQGKSESNSQTKLETTKDERKPKVFTVLDRPAAQNFNTGEALITLIQIYGIQLSDDNGPRTLREVTDDYFDYLTQVAPRTVTKESLDITFQPGGALYSYFSRLLNNTEAFDAVYARLRSLAE